MKKEILFMFYYIAYKEGYENAIHDRITKKPIICTTLQSACANAYAITGDVNNKFQLSRSQFLDIVANHISENGFKESANTYY